MYKAVWNTIVGGRGYHVCIRQSGILLLEIAAAIM